MSIPNDQEISTMSTGQDAADEALVEQTAEATADMAPDSELDQDGHCLLYTSPSPRDRQKSRMPSSA